MLEQMDTRSDLPILLFTDTAQWRQWLEENYRSNGIWLRFFKKDRGESIHYDGALDEALCYGWIDSQVAKYDDNSYLQKFTPRRPRSIWSKRNIEHITRLTEAGRMMPSGIAEVEAAKADGRWQRAYDSSTTMETPKDFLEELAKHPKALAFFATLNKTNLYAINWRLQTAKTATTRERRMQTIIDMLDKETKFH